MVLINLLTEMQIFIDKNIMGFSFQDIKKSDLNDINNKLDQIIFMLGISESSSNLRRAIV